MNDRPPPDAPAHAPIDRAAMIAAVRRRVGADPDLAAADPPAIDRAIEEAIARLWDASRVKTFVPVLALRDVRALLAAADRPAGMEDDDG